MAPRITFVAEIGLRVRNLAEMVAFYERVLGFEVTIAREYHAFLNIGELPSPLGQAGHGQLLALFKRDQAPESARSSLDHLAFEIPPEDYDAERARFMDMGLVVRERSWPDSLDWPARSFFFYDPEGNVIELIARMGTGQGAA